MPNEQKFVERFEMAVMQYAILAKAKEGGVTKENLQQLFQKDLQFQSNHFDHCIRTLEQDGHIRVEGNRINVTDDGREDVEKLQQLAIALPQVTGGGTNVGKTGPTGQKTPATTGR